MDAGGRPPFFAGGPIPPSLADQYFYGFEEERRILGGFLNERPPARFGVVGGPGLGKTSLVLAVTGKVLTPRVVLDASRTWPGTPKQFLRNLVDALGVPAPTDFRWTQPPLEAYQALPMPKRGTRGILVIENAHALHDLDPGLVDELPVLAARLPWHLIATGDAQILDPVFPARIELKPFTIPTVAGFLERQLSRHGMFVDASVPATLWEFTRGHPDAVQRVAAKSFLEARRRGAQTMTSADVEAALADTVESLPTHSLLGLARVQGMMRDIFVAMCLYGLESPTEISKRLELEAKNVIVLLARLESAHGLVERTGRGKYTVADPLLKHYVRKEWGSPIVR